MDTRAAVTDTDLVQQARRGNAAALGVLLERHRAPLYALALSILGNREQAKDTVQDAFLVALTKLDVLREPAAVGAWLRAITRNAALMQLRRDREVRSRTPDVPVGLGGLSVEEAIDRVAMRDWVWAALEHLPEDQRAAVMLRFFARQSSYAQIAGVLGIPVGTVRSRLNTGKQRLANALLATAAAANRDHTVLVRERWQEQIHAIEQMDRHGMASLYFAECSPDVLIENPSLGYRTRGVVEERRNVERGLAAGVRMRLTGVIASHGVTIIEADYRNPPEDPGHCPPTHTEIRFHRHGPTTRLVLQFGHTDERRRPPTPAGGHGRVNGA